MNLHNVSGTPQVTKAQALVVFAYKNDKKLAFDSKGAGLDHSAKLIVAAEAQGRFKGAAKETVFFRSCNSDGFEHVLVVGLGDRKQISEESLRIASAVAVKTLTREKVTSAAVALHTCRKLTKTAEGAGRAMAEGILLGHYKYDELKSKKADEKETADKKELKDVFFAINDKGASRKFGQGLDTGRILAEATNFARELGNAPANLLTPVKFAERVQQVFKGTAAKVQALDKKQISALKMGCLLGVNRGSDEEPRFMIVEYFGGKKSEKPLILVGKGLTFDSGGISIKPSAGMEEMKFDMCGGAAVMGAMLAVVKMKLKKNVIGLVPSTENMPGGNAVKPGDVLTAMNGKTVEVNNTDAEGRLILADALAYACEKYEPSAIVDAATLTGACVVALGNVFSGFFCKDAGLLKRIQAASQESGERLWQLPLVDEFVEDMKGTYADLSNIGGSKGGGSSQGAGFLSQFVKDDVRWAHFDIAGTAYNTGSRLPYNPDKGASGSAVRLFAQLAMDM